MIHVSAIFSISKYQCVFVSTSLYMFYLILIGIINYIFAKVMISVIEFIPSDVYKIRF